jgi:hypothetical protein
MMSNARMAIPNANWVFQFVNGFVFVFPWVVSVSLRINYLRLATGKLKSASRHVLSVPFAASGDSKSLNAVISDDALLSYCAMQSGKTTYRKRVEAPVVRE